MSDLEQLRYPTGRFKTPAEYSEQLISKWIDEIRHLPSNVEIAIQNLDEHQLQTPYRPDGWTLVQVVHHLADSHMNAYIRFKLALTENNPVIKPYEQGLWAELPDTRLTPVNVSVTLLHALHIRWVNLLTDIPAKDFEETVFHPEQKRKIPVKELMAMYAWHGQHHLMQIVGLKERMGWE